MRYDADPVVIAIGEQLRYLLDRAWQGDGSGLTVIQLAVVYDIRRHIDGLGEDAVGSEEVGEVVEGHEQTMIEDHEQTNLEIRQGDAMAVLRALPTR